MIYSYAVLDIETTGLNRFKDKITWIGVGLATGIDQPLAKKILIDMRDNKELAKWLDVANKLKQQRCRMILQNGKFDVLFIEHHTGIYIPIHDDIMLLGTAHDMAGSHALKEMAVKYLGVESWSLPKKELIKGEAKVIKPYLRKDLDHPWELYQYFLQALTPDQWKHYRHILRPSYLAYRVVETNGIYLNKRQFKAVRKKYDQQAKEKLAVLNAQYQINWNSSQQLAKVLFEDEKLPVISKSKKTGKPSANAAVLKRLSSQGFTLPKQILEYREAETLMKMFLNRWQEDAAFDGRIHPSFGMTNVRTGRTSCSDPNLQQVPRNSEVRSCFRAPPASLTGGKRRAFFEADYSQLELRIAAEYSRDPTMLRIYAEGGDIHTSTARIFTAGREPTKDDRSKAKPVNFGFLYGMQAKGFTDYAFDNYNTVFTASESRKAREGFFALYSRLEPWHREMEARCEALGGVYNLFGRFRALPEIYSHEWGLRSSAQRKAINTPVQSTGSDMLISAMAQIVKELSPHGVTVCGTVHDSIVGECWDEDREWVEQEIKRIMINPMIMDIFEVELSVPLDVDVGWGPWGSK